MSNTTANVVNIIVYDRIFFGRLISTRYHNAADPAFTFLHMEIARTHHVVHDGVRQRIRRALRPRQRRQAQIALAQLGDDLRERQQTAAFQRLKLILADLRAAHLHGTMCLIRPETLDHDAIGRLMDIGCDGIMAPDIETAAQARAVVEAVGIKDIRTKALRSNNPCNVVRATLEGLSQLRTAEEVAVTRGKSVKEIL